MKLITSMRRTSSWLTSSIIENGTGNNTEWTKDSSYRVTAIVDQIRCSSVLLAEPSSSATTHLNRNEIATGTVLRSGEFSTTYVVTRLPRYSITSMMLPSSAIAETSTHSDDSLTFGSNTTSHSQSPHENKHRHICTSTDVSQYSLKQLNPKLIKKHSKPRGTTTNGCVYDVAAAMLVLEAQYLARFSHPNIVALRGMPFGEEYIHQVHERFFIMTDCIIETLADRLVNWKEAEDAAGPVVLKLDTHSKVFQTKLDIARQVLNALDYLQSHHCIVVLNLNPSNIGFNQMGVVQLFDLGHCQEVAPEAGPDKCSKTMDRSRNSSTHDDISINEISDMLGRSAIKEDVARQKISANHHGLSTTGPSFQMGPQHRQVLSWVNMDTVPRYLPPEFVTKGEYFLESDSYSFALILYEMLTLSKPFIALKPGQHLVQVCMEGKRPNLTLYKLPPLLEHLLRQGWEHDHKKRLKVATMKQLLSATSFTSRSLRRKRSSYQQQPPEQTNEQHSSSFSSVEPLDSCLLVSPMA